MPYPNFAGNVRVWTRERVLEALISAAAEIRGPLPSSDTAWGLIKKGRYDWPPPGRIYEFFHSFPKAWTAAGAGRRVSKKYAKWTEKEDGYLLDYAGHFTLEKIARHLERTIYATISRLNKWYKIQSRHNQGFLSAAELAKEYNCSCYRIRIALKAGKIKGRFDKKRNRWEIDPTDITPEALIILTAPKRTHKTWETDLGNYYQRYGLRRQNINGRVMVVAK